MIRFTDVVPATKPKKAAVPTPERELEASRATSPVPADAPKPAKAPRKPKKSA